MDNKEEKSFAQKFQESLGSRNLTLEKVAELSGVPVKYIEAIQKNSADKLPPSPYVRGYISRICEVMELNGEECWRDFQKDADLKISGVKDQMPRNRYAKRSLSLRKSVLLGIGLSILIVIYLGYRLNNLTGKPNLEVLEPAAAMLVLNVPSVTISGTLDTDSKLSVNSERVSVDGDGTWQKKFYLQPGLNSIEIKASKLLGREVVITKQIIYTPINTATTTAR